MSASDLYDLENIVPAAVQVVLSAGGFTSFTLAAPPTNQKQRPRTDIIFHTGSAPVSGPASLMARLPLTGNRVAAAFGGDLLLHSITACDAPGKMVHSQYRANLRAAMAQLIYSIQLTNHALVYLSEQDTKTTVHSQEGWEESVITYNLIVNVRPDAWVLLS